MKQFIWTTLEDTKRHAKTLADKLTGGEVLTLEGDLGAGKTTWTKYFAEALGVEGNVNSPTFTIYKMYEGRVPFHHLDVYRLADGEEDLGWDEIFDGEAISVVEWAQYIDYALPEERLEMSITLTEQGERLCTMHGKGARFEQLVKELANDLARD